MKIKRDPYGSALDPNVFQYERGHKAGFNDALEQVAKWHDGKIEAMKFYHEAGLAAVAIHEMSAAHVRSMKKP